MYVQIQVLIALAKRTPPGYYHQKYVGGIKDRNQRLVHGHRLTDDFGTESNRRYQVSTKALNQAIKRNEKRFPEDFMMKLTQEEKEELVTNCDRFKNLKHSTVLPKAFTEYGAIMAATVLNSEHAIEMSLYVVRTFLRIRQTIAQNKELVQKFTKLERRVSGHDNKIQAIIGTIRQLMTPSISKKRRIGF